jgi:aerobic C4-dicarboxylate transport protein
MTNMVGNGVATIVIAKWENEFDHIRANHVLNEPTFIPPEQPPVHMPASPSEAISDLDKIAK